MASRATQPYRTGAREPGQALDAMRQGSPTHLPNPQDTGRQLAGSRRSLRHTRSLFLDGLERRKRLSI